MFKPRFNALAATLTVTALATFSGAAQAQTPLSPGTSTGSVPTLGAFGGTQQGSTLVGNFTAENAGQSITGRLFSTVFSGGTTDGSFGGSSLDFYYQLVLDSGTTAVQSISLSSFANVTLAVGQTTSDVDGGGAMTPGTQAVAGGQRGFGVGTGLTFDFGTGITVGEVSNTIIVRTTSTNFSNLGGAGVLGVSGVAANTVGLVAAPVAVTAAPEPGSFVLAGMGLIGTAGAAIRRRRRAA